MHIDWTNFTMWQSLAGGLLIGLAASLLLFFNGRIAGISGIVGGLLRPVKGDISWRVAFISGLMVSSFVYLIARPLPVSIIDADIATLIIAGVLVGFGTRYGSGCTSGHGVCGLSRGSLRSFVATTLFMAAGVLTVYFVKHLMG
jgi:uncharacterized membrane protein YedE/YeeE